MREICLSLSSDVVLQILWQYAGHTGQYERKTFEGLHTWEVLGSQLVEIRAIAQSSVENLACDFSAIS